MAMPSAALDLVMGYIAQPVLINPQFARFYQDIGLDYLEFSVVATCRHRAALAAVAQRMIVYGMRAMQRIYSRLELRTDRRIFRALDHLDQVNPNQNVVARVRTAVRLLQVEVETAATLLTRHPRLRREAARLRAEAEDVFSEDADSSDDAE